MSTNLPSGGFHAAVLAFRGRVDGRNVQFLWATLTERTGGAGGCARLPPHGRAQEYEQRAAYDVFHLAFGVAGLAIALWGDHSAARAFLVSFGLIDLYWAPALDARGLWTPTDELLHLVLGRC